MRVQRQSLAAQVSAVVLERIGAGDWSLGAKLPGEATLAAELGVGRSTVREAIRDLAGRGVLDTRQGAGVFVVAAAPTEEWSEVVRRVEIGEVVEGRLAVEVEAAHRAAQRRTPRDLTALETTLAHRGCAEVAGSDEEFVDADLVFHQAVVRAAHNTVLEELFTSFDARVRTAMLEVMALAGPRDQRPRRAHHAHVGILEAIRDRDAELAAARSRAHLEDLRRDVLAATGVEGR